jgi:hypothetical protein
VVPGRLRPRIFSTFGTTRVVHRQPNAPAAFTPGEIPGTHFQRLSQPQGTWFCRKEPRKKSQVTPPGIDLGTVRLVAQRLNHYAPRNIIKFNLMNFQLSLSLSPKGACNSRRMMGFLYLPVFLLQKLGNVINIVNVLILSNNSLFPLPASQ